MKLLVFFLVYCILVFPQILFAQFEFNGQIVQRGEYRHGYNKLIETNQEPAVFIAQRLRLQTTYSLENVNFYVAVQDVRTWGSSSVTKISDTYFSLHEGWVQLGISKSWSLKLGRQELSYDNQRVLGAVDWLLQGRSHDFGLFMYEKENQKLHFGGGYNKEAQTLNNIVYTVQNNYQNAQFARYENKWKTVSFSGFFWNQGVQFVEQDSAGNVKKKALRYSQTFGISDLQYRLKNTTFASFGYYQSGKDIANQQLNAFDIGVQLSHYFTVNDSIKSGLQITAGMEVISGKPTNYTGNQNNSFLSLYGTNHVLNGYMDLFYVNRQHENSVGLRDTFLKLKYDLHQYVFLSLNVHQYFTHANVYNPNNNVMSKNLGQEFDLTIGYVINKYASLQGGYSHFLSSATFHYLNNVSMPNAIQNWAYLMLLVRPGHPRKFVGLSF